MHPNLIPARVVDALYGAVESAFATTAFLFAAPPLDDTPSTAPAITAVVYFDAPVKGYLAIRCSSALLPMLTANMLGDETANSPAMQWDALGEIANVICGNVLPELIPQVPFTLRAPRVRPAEEPEMALVDPPTITLDVEDYRVDATLTITDFGDES